MINGKPCAVTMTMEDHQTKVMGSAVCGMTSFMKTYNMGDITGSIIHAPAVAVTGSTPVQQSEGVFNLHTMAHAKGQDEGPASGHAGASSSGKDECTHCGFFHPLALLPMLTGVLTFSSFFWCLSGCLIRIRVCVCGCCQRLQHRQRCH
jgi:hypothetical protein